MENNIQHHPIPDFSTHKEIRCRDCGHVYAISAQSISSTCEKCGNIAFHPEFSTERVTQARLQEQFFAKREIPKRAPLVTPQARTHHEISRRPDIDAFQIEELAIQNQQEWQIWAKVTENFGDPNRHLAYLSFVTRNLIFDRASERYKAHRLRFALIPEERWQADRAEEMLDRISALCVVQFERATRTQRNEFEKWAIQKSGSKMRPMLRAFFAMTGFLIAINLIITIFFR